MGMPITVERRCPADGAVFEHRTTASYSIMGRDLDGRPRGSWFFPLDPPQCPACGLVTGGWVDEQPRETLKALTDHEDWPYIRDEATYYVLYIQMVRLKAGKALDRIDALLQATWQVGVKTVAYARYARMLGEEMDAASTALKQDETEAWPVLMSFVANVERQAGNWEAAERRLARIEAAGPFETAVMDRLARTRRLIEARDAGPASPGDD